MSSSNYPYPLTDEMLSAFIDNELAEDEYNLIESAIASDAELAWRVSSLRQTVAYLNDLPDLTPPRSFALPTSMSVVADPLPSAARVVHDTINLQAPSRLRTEAARIGFWESIGNFFLDGSPIFRNAMAASMALLVLLVGGGLIFSYLLLDNRSLLETTSSSQEMLAENNPAEVGLEGADNTATISSSNGENSSGSENAVNQSSANSVTENTDTVEETASSSVAGPILTSLPTPINVAVLPTATAMPTVIPITSVAPANAQQVAKAGPTVEAPRAEYADPSVTPAQPLTAPTSLPVPTPLPAPEMSVAQAPAALSAAPSAAESTVVKSAEADQTASDLNGDGAVDAASGAAAESDIDASDESTTGSSADASDSDMAYSSASAPAISDKVESLAEGEIASLSSSRRVEIVPTLPQNEIEEIAEESAAMGIQPFGSTGATAVDDTLNEEDSTELSSAGVNATVVGATVVDATVAEPAEVLEAEAVPDLTSIVVEVNENTGALLGVLRARDNQGVLRPIALATLRLAFVETGQGERQEPPLSANSPYTTTDKNGLFILVGLEPNTYAIVLDLPDADLRLPSPADEAREFVVEIQAGVQTNLGIIEYEEFVYPGFDE